MKRTAKTHLSFLATFIVAACLALLIPGTALGGAEGVEMPNGPNETTGACTNQLDNCPGGCPQCPCPPPGPGGSGGGGPKGGPIGPSSQSQGAATGPAPASGGGGPLSMTDTTSGGAGGMIDVGHNSSYYQEADLSIPTSGGMAFHIERRYSSGRFPHTVTTELYPLAGESWQMNIDTRVFMESGTQNRMIQLPDGKVRSFNWDATSSTWKSREAQGFLGVLTYDDVSKRYTLTYPNGEKLRYNWQGFLVEWETTTGQKMTITQEQITIGGKQIYRPTKISAPEADGRYLELSYNTTKTHLLEEAVLKNDAESYSQTVLNYDYEMDGESTQAYLLTGSTKMGESRGNVYQYGSWDPTANNGAGGVVATDTTDRTLARIATVSPTLGERTIHAVKYVEGGFNLPGWPNREPVAEYAPTYSSSSPGTPAAMEVAYSTNGPVGTGYSVRVYNGASYSGAYTDYTSNSSRDLYQSLPSAGYGGMMYQREFRSDTRLVNKIFMPGTTSGSYYSEFTYDVSASDHMNKANLTQSRDFQGRFTTYNSYDTTWRKPTSITDPYGRVSSITYNTTHGKVDYVSNNRNNHTVDYGYNGYGNLTSVVDSLGGTTSYTYYGSGEGRLESVTQPDGRSVTYGYNPMGLVETITPSDGPAVEYAYDGDLLTGVTVGGDTTTYGYDELGRRTSVTDPKGLTTTTTYDGAGRVIKVTAPDDSFTSFTYDAQGNLAAFLDAEGNRTGYLYDHADRLISAQQWDDTNNAWQWDAIVYGDAAGCGCGGASGQIAKTYHFTDYPSGTDTITWKTFEYDSLGHLRYVKYYQTLTYDPQDPGDLGTLDRTVEYVYNAKYDPTPANPNSGDEVPTDLVTYIEDSALPFTNKYYIFTYDNDLRLTKLIHPDNQTEEFYYDAYDRMTARRDVDGGITSVGRDTLQRLHELTDPWGHVTTFNYNGSSDPDPLGTLKEVLYSNGAKVEYAYDDLNRLETLSNKATGGGVMTSFGYTYDDDGNITRVDLNQNGAASAWAYVYDNLNRLQFEERRDSANDPLWRRRYDYDDAGNRASMKHWRDDTNTTSTVTYSYNDLNQLTSRSSPERDYYYDAFGNLTSMNDAVYQHTLSWTLDNRLKEVSMDEGLTVTQYAYDYQGARILRTDDDGAIRRYYFRGLTEEVVKESVAASPGVNDFAYTEKEDGESASEWYAYYGSPSISAVGDTAHHPLGDGATAGKVILVNGTAACVAVIGDNDAGGYNPNDTAWNSTKRVLSFWYKGGFAPLRVAVTTSAGSKEVHYYATSGTDAVDGSGNVVVYLGTSAAGSTWLRFERDLAADWTRVTGGASTWTNTDGLAVQTSATYSYDISVDDIRLSNARTVTHNSLTGGAIGQIASSREVTSAGGNGSLGITDTWYHYDHIGNVMNFSNSSGALVANSIQHQDAWGNVLSSSTTGVWATMTDGRHLTTKECDADAGLYYFWQRWTDSTQGRFTSHDFVGSRFGPSQYLFTENRPTMMPDSTGLWALDPGRWDESIEECIKHKKCEQGGNCCAFVQCVFDDYKKMGGVYIPVGEAPGSNLPPLRYSYPPGMIYSTSPEFMNSCMSGPRGGELISGGHIYVTDSSGGVCECQNRVVRGTNGPERKPQSACNEESIKPGPIGY